VPRGGKRPGAGRKKGSKEPKTIEKEAARAALRQIVLAHMNDMVAAQIDHAQGIKYLVAREKKTGKFKHLTEAEAILKLGQESDLEMIEVYEKEPSVQAFTDLMNRAIDKPTETVQQDISLTIRGLDERLRNARKRLGKA